MAKIKNSHQAIQISQNQGSISFQFLIKSIVTFFSVWVFLRLQMVPGSKIKVPLLRLAPLFQKPLIKDYLFVK